MTDKETLSKVNETFDIAINNCGGKRRMLAALNISESWMHALRNGRSLTITMALKLCVLSGSKYRWDELCPEEAEKINAVAEYIVD